MTVRELMNHMVAGNLLFAGAARGEQLDMTVFERDHSETIRARPTGVRRTKRPRRGRGPGCWKRRLEFGGMPGAFVIRLHLTEELVHGWDLAQSTGQDTAIDARLAATALEAMQQVPPDMLRSGIGFGAEVIVSGDAPVHERLVAFLGRDPAASPA